MDLDRSGTTSLPDWLYVPASVAIAAVAVARPERTDLPRGVGNGTAKARSKTKGVDMTRTANTLISMLTVIAVSVGLASSAMAYYSTGSQNASRDDHQVATPQSAPGSPNAIVGNEGGQPSGNVTANPPADSVNATIVGNEGGLPSGNLTTDPRLFSSASGDPRAVSSSDGFDWGAALIGAGAALGLATALGLGMARRRTRLEPSV